MKFPALTRKTQCRVPTISGWFLLLFILFAIFGVFILNVHQFLSENRPINGEILVVEGWMPDYCFFQAASIFSSGQYKMIVATGGPLEYGSYLQQFRTYAELGGATLVAAGIPDSLVFAVPAKFIRKDRTIGTAIALREWLDSTGNIERKVDLCSFSVHSRRSALLFKKALGRQIGVIAIENQGYNADKWWKYSEGVRSVMSEFIAYLYALLFFNT